MTMMFKTAMAAITVAGLAMLATPALAADNPMKICGAKYREAKAAGTLPAGQTWMQFLAECRGALPKAAGTASASTAPAGAKRPRSAAQTATASRQHECGNQWKADKAAGKIAPGQTWPQYWSACNKRLK